MTGHAEQRVRRALQPDGALRMAIAVPLGRLGPRAALRDRLDVDLQSRSPAHGPGWIYAKAAAAMAA